MDMFAHPGKRGANKAKHRQLVGFRRLIGY